MSSYPSAFNAIPGVHKEKFIKFIFTFRCAQENDVNFHIYNILNQIE